MGGYGSGRQRARPVAEECPALRVRDLRPALALIEQGYPHAPLALRWQLAGQVRLVLRATLVREHADAVRLLCSGEQRFVSESPSLVSQPDAAAQAGLTPKTLALCPTPQPLGGRRWWLSCPTCAHRVAVLFLHQRRWGCRRCAGVIYTSSLRSDKRLVPLLRAISLTWSGAAPDLADAILANLAPLPAAATSATGQLALHSARHLRLLQKAGQLALRRFERGVPLYRERRPAER